MGALSGGKVGIPKKVAEEKTTFVKRDQRDLRRGEAS